MEESYHNQLHNQDKEGSEDEEGSSPEEDSEDEEGSIPEEDSQTEEGINEEDEEESELEFNCEPVKRESRYVLPSEGQNWRIPNSIRDAGIKFNARQRRAAANVAIQGLSTGYVDQDTSGTYDPKYERATAPPSPVKRVQKPKELDENGEPNPANIRRAGYTYPIVLRFNKESSLAYLRSIAQDQSVSSNPSGTGNRGTDTQEGGKGSSSDPQENVRRSKRVKRVISSSRQDGLTIDTLTQGHPQRRGCKACFYLGDDNCSMIENALYPCDACEDTGVDCDPIIPPKFKKPCQRCKFKRIKCSYLEDGGKGVGSCSGCENAGETCIAAPLDKRLEYKFNGTNKPAEPSEASEDNPVLFERLEDEFEGTDSPSDSGEASEDNQILDERLENKFEGTNNASDSVNASKGNGCENAGESSISGPLDERLERKFDMKTYQPVPKSAFSAPKLEATASSVKNRTDYNDEKTVDSSSRTTRDDSTLKKGKQVAITTEGDNAPASISNYGVPRPDPPNSKAGMAPSRAQKITITTSFCHPIKFYYVPGRNNRFPCSWCDSPVFGLWGHSPRQVEVIPYYGNRGYEEIAGGHSQHGVQQTRMCVQCTYQRIKIMCCSGHMVKRIERLDPKAFDLAAIGQSLLALAEGNFEGAELVKRVRWCSVCVSPAEFACCTVDDEGSGCGMHLCKTCADLLSGLEKNRPSSDTNWKTMDKLVKLWRGVLRIRDDIGELRADVEFLITTGELANRMRQGMQLSHFDISLDKLSSRQLTRPSLPSVDHQRSLPKQSVHTLPQGYSHRSMIAPSNAKQKDLMDIDMSNSPYTSSQTPISSFEQLSLTPTSRPWEVRGNFTSRTTPVSEAVGMNQHGNQRGVWGNFSRNQYNQASSSYRPSEASFGFNPSNSMARAPQAPAYNSSSQQEIMGFGFNPSTSMARPPQAFAYNSTSQQEIMGFSTPHRSAGTRASGTSMNPIDLTSPTSSPPRFSETHGMEIDEEFENRPQMHSTFGGFGPSAQWPQGGENKRSSFF